MKLKLKDHDQQLVKLIDKTHENRNEIVANENVDDVHEDRNNNLTHYHNGRCWDIIENFDSQRMCYSSIIGFPS